MLKTLDISAVLDIFYIIHFFWIWMYVIFLKLVDIFAILDILTLSIFA